MCVRYWVVCVRVIFFFFFFVFIQAESKMARAISPPAVPRAEAAEVGVQTDLWRPPRRVSLSMSDLQASTSDLQPEQA